ncbi:hypothetical protein SLA2020_350610 [Shorea laevis]
MAMKQHPLTAITFAQAQSSPPTAPTNPISTDSSLLFPLTAHGPLGSPTPPPARSLGSLCVVALSVKTVANATKEIYNSAPNS